MAILQLVSAEGNAMPVHDPAVVVDLARSSALARIRAEELDRQQAILDGFELAKLKAIFQIRAYIVTYGLSRVETWVANEAKELGVR